MLRPGSIAPFARPKLQPRLGEHLPEALPELDPLRRMGLPLDVRVLAHEPLEAGGHVLHAQGLQHDGHEDVPAAVEAVDARHLQLEVAPATGDEVLAEDKDHLPALLDSIEDVLLDVYTCFEVAVARQRRMAAAGEDSRLLLA